jgi:predicted CXXCH cytochrome family protein
MRRDILWGISVLPILLLAVLLGGCGAGNKEGGANVQAQGTVGTACFACHGNAATAPQMTVSYTDSNTSATFTTTVNLFVDPIQYARSTHGGIECLVCHVGMSPVPPHNAPRAYGGWGAIWPLNDTITSTSPGTTDADVNHTLNYYVVPAAACLRCHGTPTLMGFLNSKHLNDNDRAWLPSATSPWSAVPRQATFPAALGGIQINEDYNKVDCQLCHIGSNCGTCHFKSPVGQQSPGDAWTAWSTYDAGPDYATKLAQINRWLDWTQNIASHNFNTAANLKTSNDVCSVCHSGFSDTPFAATAYPQPYDLANTVAGTSYDGHSENDEVALSAQRGIHFSGTFKNPPLLNTPMFCTDCHVDTHTSNLPQTLSMGWDTRQSPTKCINCHADKVFAPNSLHADVDCTGCHDAELPVIRDATTNMVIPFRVDVNIVKTFPSHNIIHGIDIDCATKCHNLGTLITAPVPPADQTKGNGIKIHQ